MDKRASSINDQAWPGRGRDDCAVRIRAEKSLQDHVWYTEASTPSVVGRARARAQARTSLCSCSHVHGACCNVGPLQALLSSQLLQGGSGLVPVEVARDAAALCAHLLVGNIAPESMATVAWLRPFRARQEGNARQVWHVESDERVRR